MSQSPLTVSVTRGGITESQHAISAVVLSSDGSILHQWGDIQKPVYPRSAIKALQALAFVERGGPSQFQFTDAEIALLCASHNGEPEHVTASQAMLKKTRFAEADYECGAHWPMRVEAGYALAKAQQEPNQCHNNCSGKHAGMLGLASLLEVPHAQYIEEEHPVQQTIRQTMSEMCDIDMADAPSSPDGCSAPTWAIPLKNLALGFARFADPTMLDEKRAAACKTLFNAVVNNPFMVAGTNRYCTDMMNALAKRVFLKVGAEGVYIAAIPDLKLAIAMKCEDGAFRGAESAMTKLLDFVGATDHVPTESLDAFRTVKIQNWNKRHTGDIVCETAL